MLTRFIITPDREATLETLIYLGKTRLQGEEAKDSIDQTKTLLEIACYPGKDPRLAHNLHAVIFQRKDSQNSDEHEIICPNAEAADLVVNQYNAHPTRTRKYAAKSCSIDYVKNTKTSEMLYSSHKNLMNHFNGAKK